MEQWYIHSENVVNITQLINGAMMHTHWKCSQCVQVINGAMINTHWKCRNPDNFANITCHKPLSKTILHNTV